MIHFNCPSCGHSYHTEDQFAGRPFTCLACKTPTKVPEGPTTEYIREASVADPPRRRFRIGLLFGLPWVVCEILTACVAVAYGVLWLNMRSNYYDLIVLSLTTAVILLILYILARCRDGRLR